VIAYNAVMSLKDRPIPNRSTHRPLSHYLVHWLVLCCLVLGQLAMSASMALAHTPEGSQTKIPVCTSTGVIYVAWSDLDVKSDQAQDPSKLATTNDTTHAGACVWCTISPHQLRLGLHNDVVADFKAVDRSGYLPTNHFLASAFKGNPHAPPRAPPFV
jgi:hypothetical protein